MKTAQNILLLNLLAIVFSSCFFGNSEKDRYSEESYATGSTSYNEVRSSENQNKLVLKTTLDANTGMPSTRFPLPTDWNVHNDKKAPYFITAPNDIKVYQTNTTNFAYANDAFALETIKMMGQQNIAPVVSIEQAVQKYTLPIAEKNGSTLITTYKLPKLTKLWKQLLARLYNSGSQRTVDVLGSEWQDQNGKKALLITVQIITKQGTFTHWQLLDTRLETPNEHFEFAKNIFIHAQENTQVNPKWLQATNQQMLANKQKSDAYWAEKSRQSARTHQQNMAAIQAAGNTSRIIAKNSSDALDASYNSYMQRSAESDASQSSYVNGIWERQTVTSPSNGTQYQVDGYDSNVWVNQDNEYIGTDNALYDPNLDTTTNNQSWEQMDSDDGW